MAIIRNTSRQIVPRVMILVNTTIDQAPPSGQVHQKFVDLALELLAGVVKRILGDLCRLREIPLSNHVDQALEGGYHQWFRTACFISRMIAINSWIVFCVSLFSEMRFSCTSTYIENNVLMTGICTMQTIPMGP